MNDSEFAHFILGYLLGFVCSVASNVIGALVARKRWHL